MTDCAPTAEVQSKAGILCESDLRFSWRSLWRFLIFVYVTPCGLAEVHGRLRRTFLSPQPLITETRRHVEEQKSVWKCLLAVTSHRHREPYSLNPNDEKRIVNLGGGVKTAVTWTGTSVCCGCKSCVYVFCIYANRISVSCLVSVGARGGAVGWGTALQVGRSRIRFPMVSLEFFIDMILLAALWPLGSTQPLTGMSKS